MAVLGADIGEFLLLLVLGEVVFLDVTDGHLDVHVAGEHSADLFVNLGVLAVDLLDSGG